MSWRKVCLFQEISNNSIEKVSLDTGKHIAVYRVGQEVFATSDLCTHGEASLSDEGELEGYIVECTRHSGTFDIRTGKATGMPCIVSLNAYKTKVEDGFIWVKA